MIAGAVNSPRAVPHHRLDFLQALRPRQERSLPGFFATGKCCKVCLLDHPKSVNQICALERRTGTTRDIIDHGRGANAHDDLANAVAGVAVMTAQKHRRFAPDLSVVSLPTYCVNGVITNTLDGGVRHGGRVQTMADVRDADW